METHYEDNLIFLRKHIVAHQNTLVLKPSDSYGGKDVMIGRETDVDTWANLVSRILSRKEDWVVQRYVDITQMTVPIMNGDTVNIFAS